jgi:acetyl-CoA synthetase
MKLGARFVPIFCGYGQEALRERLASAEAKVLFACASLQRRGQRTDTGAAARAAAADAKSVERVVWTDTPDWEDFLHSGGCLVPTRHPLAIAHEPALACESTAAEDPCLIIYTSGTTGQPKGTVHTHIGCLAQMGKELRYAFDVRPGEPFFWVTDIGWMMGPWELIGCLLYRTPVVLLDGAPNYPTSGRIWEICAKARVVTLGCSPTLIRMLMRGGSEADPRKHDLSALRILGSTGELWDEAAYRWYFEQVGQQRCPVINIAGGTEIVGCHLQPYPIEPLKSCSLGGPALGMDVDVFTDDGKPAARGTRGHLVCKQPAPSMTKSFLRDDARYLETYFSRFPGVWCHGDWAAVDEDGQWFLFGRTDDTLKIAGHRVGPGEIEDALTSHPAVSEAAAIGVPDEIKGTALVCFVILKQGAGEPSELELITHVAQRLGKPLAPRQVHVVAALPKTRSGKIVRAAIARAYAGQPAGDLTSIDNPAALDAIRASVVSQPA